MSLVESRAHPSLGRIWGTTSRLSFQESPLDEANLRRYKRDQSDGRNGTEVNFMYGWVSVRSDSVRSSSHFLDKV